MKPSLSADDIWNIGFDHFFDPNVKLPKTTDVANVEGAELYLSKGLNDAKNYREALNRKENSNA